MKKHLYLVLILALTACAVPQTPLLPVEDGQGVHYTETLPPIASQTPTLTPTETPTSEPTVAPEISQDVLNPEKLPYLDFAYLTSTEFAQQVLDWEAQGKFPEVPDTAIPLTGIDIFPDSGKRFLQDFGLVPIYNLTKRDVRSHIYQNHPERIPYILAGVWKTELNSEIAFFVLKKWKNADNTPGFEGLIYKPRSTNEKAISFELIDHGFGSNRTIAGGVYFLKGEHVSPFGNSGCEAYFSKMADGIKNSSFCDWYFENPDLVYNREFYSNWEKSGKITNYVNVNGQQAPFVPISMISGNPINANQ